MVGLVIAVCPGESKKVSAMGAGFVASWAGNGYGGNLTWRKQEYFIEYVLGVPISQGSLAKMQRWFQESLLPSYQQWLSYVKKPGVRCVDETTYCIDGIKYWLWVATSDQVCVLLLAPTRSSAELKRLLGEDFDGILSSDCKACLQPSDSGGETEMPNPFWARPQSSWN